MSRFITTPDPISNPLLIPGSEETLSIDDDTLRFSNRLLTLTFERSHGQLLQMDCALLPVSLITLPSVPLSVRFAGLQITKSAFRRHTVLLDKERRFVTLRLTYDLSCDSETDVFELACDYRLFPGQLRLEVSATLACLSLASGEAHLEDFVFSLPGLSVGDVGETTVTVPGPYWPKSYLRPRTPLADLQGVYRRFHGAPDGGFGVIALYNPTHSLGMIAWMDCGTETNYHPSLQGEHDRLSLIFEDHRAYRLLPGMTVPSDTLRLEVVAGSFSELLQRHRAWAMDRLPLDDRTPDWAREATILEVYPKYYPGGFREITDRLPDYAAIGFNTLYLMPHWTGGYSPLDLFTIDPAHGGTADLQALVKRAHALGMRVLFDMVIHGFHEDSPVCKKHPEIFIRTPSGELARHPTWKSVSTDWASPSYHAYMVELVRHDLQTYDIDGYRVDAASYKGTNWDPLLPTPAYRSGSAAVSLMEGMLAALRFEKPDAVLLSEVFGPVFYTACNFVHDNQTEALAYFQEQMDVGKVTAADYRNHLSDVFDLLPVGANRVFYARNHDTSWFYRFHGYTPRFLAMEAIHTLCAIPEMFAGDRDYPYNPDDTPSVFAYWHRLFALRRRYPELRAGAICFSEVVCDHPMVFTALRCGEAATALIVVSLAATETDIVLSLPGAVGELTLTDPQTDAFSVAVPCGPHTYTLSVKACQTLVGRLPLLLS